MGGYSFVINIMIKYVKIENLIDRVCEMIKFTKNKKITDDKIIDEKNLDCKIYKMLIIRWYNVILWYKKVYN